MLVVEGRGDVGCEPDIPGHECVAEVVAVGASISGLQVGQVVTLNPNNPLDDSEKLIAEAQAKIDGSRKQIAEADDLIAESSAVEDDEPARAPGPMPSLTGRYTSTPALIRYTGTAHWALADAAKVGSFFISRFGPSPGTQLQSHRGPAG